MKTAFDAVPKWIGLNVSLEPATKGMDVVVHAAGLDAKLCAANSIKALEVNGLYTAMMVEATVASGFSTLYILLLPTSIKIL